MAAFARFLFCCVAMMCLTSRVQGDVLSGSQKELVKDIADGAGGVLQQLIASRGAVRAAEAEAQAQVAAAIASAPPPLPAPLPQNLVRMDQLQLQAPQFRQGYGQGPYQGPGYGQYPPQGYNPYGGPYQQPYQGQPQGYPGQGYPGQGYPYPAQQQVNPVGIPPTPAAVPPASVQVQNGPGLCSTTETSPQAVERCINAVRTNPNAFLPLFPCSISGLSPRKPLVSDFALAKAAYAHSQDLAKMGTVGHTGSDGSDVVTRAHVRAGFPTNYVGENAAGGQTSAQEVVFGWMCSEGHRDNVMSCDYDTFGTGVVQGGWPYWVQNFGCRSGACTC